MKITAKLAYSQLKVNRSRTLWAIAAIALSTALTTAVCSFVASGNAMIVGFLGPHYGEYGSTYVGMLLVPAILFGLIILSMSVIVISNVFRISAGERVSQFGILKCVGATEKQITESVMYESVFLSVVGIPFGIILGLLLAFAGISVANCYLSDLDALAHIMITEIHLHATFVVSSEALLISALISFLVVLYSAWRPAHKAAKASAVESVSGGTMKVKHVNLHTSDFIQRIFKYEGVLAVKNIRRNGRNFRATVIALSAGVILFICLGSLSGQAKKMEALMQIDVDESVISEYTSACNRDVNEKTGMEESIYLSPIDSRQGDKITEKLEQYDGKSIFGFGDDMETYYSDPPKEFVSDEMLNALTMKEMKTDELRVDIITLDEKNYRKICKKAGVEFGSTILLNHYSYNDNGTDVHLIPFLPTLKNLELYKADGSTSHVTIDGYLTQDDIPKELFGFNTNPIRLIVPQAIVRGYSWYSSPDDVDGFIEYANDVLNEAFPEEEDSTYMSSGFNTRVFKINDYMKVMNMAIMLVLIFMYSFVVVLMMIGFTNVVSTMSTNVLMRSREFAVLQSVGMTPEGLKRMLNFESILCSIRSLLFGLPIGVAMTYLINKPIRSMYPIPYEFPWLPVILCMIGVIAITCGITRIALHKLSNQNLIESIRSESGVGV